jgi:hypothetical protein
MKHREYYCTLQVVVSLHIQMRTVVPYLRQCDMYIWKCTHARKIICDQAHVMLQCQSSRCIYYHVSYRTVDRTAEPMPVATVTYRTDNEENAANASLAMVRERAVKHLFFTIWINVVTCQNARSCICHKIKIEIPCPCWIKHLSKNNIKTHVPINELCQKWVLKHTKIAPAYGHQLSHARTIRAHVM